MDIELEYRKLDDIEPNPLNPRGELDASAQDIQELAESIRIHGLLQPIIITPNGLIIAGHRRRVACIQVRMQKVPVIVRDISEQEQLEIMLVENIQRKDLTAVQAAEGFALLQKQGLSIEAIAQKVSWGKDTVRKHLALLTLPAEIRMHFAQGRLALGYIFPLCELKDPQKQIALANQALQQGWLVNQMMSAVNQSKNNGHSKLPPAPKRSKQELRYDALMDELQKMLKIRMQLQRLMPDNESSRQKLSVAIADLEMYLEKRS